MSRSAIVPLIPHTSLFLRGMAAQCPALGALVAFAGRDPERRLRRERILELLLRSAPRLPEACPEDAERLCRSSIREIAALVVEQHGCAEVTLHRLWRRTWSQLQGEDREFGLQASILLTEIYRLSRADLARASEAP